VKRGCLIPIPQGWYLVAPDRWSTLLRTPLLSWKGKLRMACEIMIPKMRNGTLESPNPASNSLILRIRESNSTNVRASRGDILTEASPTFPKAKKPVGSKNIINTRM
jgi:hypothetical protein